MVVLGFTVTDNKGKYVNGLKPRDLKVFEDDIGQKLATFAEGAHLLERMSAFGERGQFLPDVVLKHLEVARLQAVHVLALVIGYCEAQHNHVDFDMERGLIGFLGVQPKARNRSRQTSKRSDA